MCEKAEEIQKKWILQDGDLFFHRGRNNYCISGIFMKSKFLRKYVGTRNILWLPRQDQLQEMVIDNCESLNHLLYKILSFHADSHRKYTSMEQLWLAFVMKEKYSKIWDGKEWVKYE